MGEFGTMVRQHFQGLRPPRKEIREQESVGGKDVWKLLRGLTIMQWITFFCGWLAWTYVVISSYLFERAR